MSAPKVTFLPGNIVWVHLLNRIWWPGRIVSTNDAPGDMSEFSSSKRKILAIVYFERDDSYEIVYNEDKMFMYSCSKKMEFVQKGLVMYKKQNDNKKVPCKFEMLNFIKDVITFEKETNGDVDIFVPLEQAYDAEHTHIKPLQRKEIYALFTTEKQKRDKLRKQKKQLKRLSQQVFEVKKPRKHAAAKTAKTAKTAKASKTEKTAKHARTAKNTKATKATKTIKVTDKQSASTMTTTSVFNSVSTSALNSTNTKTTANARPLTWAEIWCTDTLPEGVYRYSCQIKDGCDYHTNSYGNLKSHMLKHKWEQRATLTGTPQTEMPVVQKEKNAPVETQKKRKYVKKQTLVNPRKLPMRQSKNKLKKLQKEILKDWESDDDEKCNGD